MEEKIVLQGTKKELMQIIPQMTAMYQLLDTLDLESGYTKENIFPERKYYPLIRLHFIQDSDFKPGTNQPKGRGRNRTKGKLSFRLMDETTETITEANLTALGQRIKQVFGENNGYVWRKGKEMYCYADWSKGYQLQILARSEVQAKDLVTKILSLQNHTPIWKYMTKSENLAEAEAYPNIPETKVILGEQTTLPLNRANVEVRFIYTDARISPLTRPILIYDRRGKRAKALIK